MEEVRSRREKITEMIGEASLLFGPSVGVGEFDSTKGIEIVDRIMALFEVPDGVNVQFSDGFIQIEGIKISAGYLKEVLRNPPTHLFSVKRVGDELEFTTWHASAVQLRSEFITWLDTQAVTSDNIGQIRSSCFVPWDSEWNAFVRDETALRENKPAASAG